MDEPVTSAAVVEAAVDVGSGELEKLFAGQTPAGPAPSEHIDGVVIGRLVAIAESGTTPLVLFPGQPTSTAQPARATLDLHAGHIGRQVVLTFELGDPTRPIVIGCLHEPLAVGGSAFRETATVDVDVDGDRLLVSAREQLVLRCGKASLTLTKEGKVIIQGAYVSSQSSGVLRIKGGSVQIN